MDNMISGATRGVIAVCGATGRQGGAVARRLLTAGWRVRALTRSPESQAARALVAAGAEVAHADLKDPVSLERAFGGAEGAFGVTDFWEHGLRAEIRMGRNLIEAAERVGVRHLVFSSVGATERTAGLGITHFEGKAEIEDRLRAASLSWSILRPVTFMENFNSPRYRHAICREGVVRFGFETGRPFQMIAMADLAAFASLAFAGEPEIAGRATELASDAFTMDELAEVLGARVGREVRYKVLPSMQLRILAALVVATRSQGRLKVGPSLINQFRWNNQDAAGGWSADIARLRSIHPEMLTLRDWVATIDWASGLGSTRERGQT